MKYFGPAVDDGQIDIEKIGTSLIALNRIFRKFSKKEAEKDFSLKLGKVQKNCTEVNVFLQQVTPIVQPAVTAGSILMIAKATGIQEFGKQFFGMLGQQIALELFAKGKSLIKKKEIAKNGQVFVALENSLREERLFPKEIYDNLYEYAPYIKDFVQLEESKEEKMKIGYYQSSNPQDVAEIRYTEKDFFQITHSEKSIEERLDEDFDESNAEERLIVGKFIDYFGMARKYHFSFQARKNIEGIGKQKILCKLKSITISEVIDLLKPENQKKNICIFGKATLDKEGKVDKIYIEWINSNENYNPDQERMF